MIKTATVALVTMSADAVLVTEAGDTKEVKAVRRSPARLLLSVEKDEAAALDAVLPSTKREGDGKNAAALGLRWWHETFCSWRRR